MMRAHRTFQCSSSSSSLTTTQRKVNAIDARLDALREEARTGLASHEVRRTLIKEELRPPPRPIPTPPAQARRGVSRHTSSPSAMTTSASASPLSLPGHVNGVRHPSTTHVETAGADDDDLPAAWLIGEFQVDGAAAESITAGSALSSSPSLATSDDTSPAAAVSPSPHAEAKGSRVEVGSRASYANALQAYKTLCSTANDVVYDVLYEEGLRRVESRDGRTGLATSWLTRRASAPLLGSATALFAVATGSNPAQMRGSEGEGRLGSFHGQLSGQHAASAMFPCASPSSSSCGLAAAVASPPSRSSLYTTASLPRQRSRGPSSVCSDRPPLRKPTPSSTAAPHGTTPSSVGTAVIRSSAAHYATALRQLVRAQREQGESPRDARGRLNSTRVSSSSFFSSSFSPSSVFATDAVKDGADSVEWRTRVAAAMTIAVCPSCSAMFPHTLTATPETASPCSATAGLTTEKHRAEERQSEAGASVECPRCGAAVDLSAAITPACRWLLPPPSTRPDIVTTASTSLTAASATTASTAAVYPLFSTLCRTEEAGSAVRQQPSVQQRPARREAAGTTDTCGTDSVGFAEAEGEESFARLVARIRASKKEAEQHAPPASAKTTASTSTEATAALTTSGATQQASVGSEAGGQILPFSSLPVSLSVLAPPAPLDPMVPRLRAALEHLYFFELMKGASKSLKM